jgi:hypothetical protein
MELRRCNTVWSVGLLATEATARRSRNQIATKITKRHEKDTKTNRQVAKDAKTIQACTFVGRFALPSLAFSAPWRFYFRACS